MHNGPTNRVDPTGLWDTGLFWDNVDKLDPAARKWFQGDFQGRTIRRNASWYKLATPKSIGGYEKFRDPNDLNKYNEYPVIFLHEGYNEIEAAYQFVNEIREGLWAAHWKAKDIDNPLEPWKAAVAAQEFKEWYIKQAAKTVVQGTQVVGAFYSMQMKGVDWAITLTDAAAGDISYTTFLDMASILPLGKGGKVTLKNKVGKELKEVSTEKLGRFSSLPRPQFMNRTHWKAPPRGGPADRVWNEEFSDLLLTFDGKVEYVKSAPINPETNRRVWGGYDPAINKITLYEGFDDTTTFHELLHWKDTKARMEKLNITREQFKAWQATPAWKAIQDASENRVVGTMLLYGFDFQ